MLLFTYSATIFTGSFLLFLIQPMIAKVILPYLGGSPMVWNTAMLFFQTVLLLGYAYAHITAHYCKPKRQALLHGGVVAFSLLLLPIGLHTVPSLDPSTYPLPWLLGTLAMSVGLPYVLLSANATLSQHWFAHTDHPAAHNPYPLYVTSNIASFAGLLSFPFLIEPLMGFEAQGELWSLLYVIFALFLFGSVFLLWRKNNGESAKAANIIPAEAPSRRQRLLWLGLAFLPSSLLQGVTMFSLTDVASLPLLWVIPLSLYLLSFIISFSRFGPAVTRACWKMLPFIVIAAMLMLVFRIGSIPGLIAHLTFFFILALACHGRLAEKRPAARFLTGYYLWIAFGGMLGGVFNNLLAPVLFTNVIEYPLAICAACLFIPTAQKLTVREVLLPLILLVEIAVLGNVFNLEHRLLTKEMHSVVQQVIFFVLVGTFAFLMLLSGSRPLQMCLLAGIFVFMMPLFVFPNSLALISAERNFFGVLRVSHNAELNVNAITHGTTLHGLQSLDEGKRLVPQAYYGPLVWVRNELFKHDSQQPLAVIGLGAGTLACIGRKSETIDFFEIDPAVIHVAENPNYFTYLKDCPPKKNIILGDARLKLGEMPDHRYAMIMVDAYNSDSLPLHLMNREALQVYRTKLATGGVLLFHITNRHLNLEPVLGTLAKDARLSALVTHSNPKKKHALLLSSRWIAMAENAETLQPLYENPAWKPLPSGTGAVWTDHYSNILEAILAHRGQR